MKRSLIFCIFFSCLCSYSFAHHIKGGEIFYTYLGPGLSPNTSQYSVTLRLFRDCNPSSAGEAPLPAQVVMGVFYNTTPYNSYSTFTANINAQPPNSISLQDYPPCISDKPTVCYQVGLYTSTITLPSDPNGFIISFQTCCRAEALNVEDDNHGSMGNSYGATYYCTVPGTNILPTGNNSSAVFKVKDTALVCGGSKFTLDFGAVDPDTQNPAYKDSLSYQFVDAYGSDNIVDASELPPNPPLYKSVDYTFPYTAIGPLGPLVSLDQTTGLITGIAPSPGLYVVCVLATEWRNGQAICSHIKDFILTVSSCNIPQATLSASYINCGDLTFHFADETNITSLINSYYWSFGLPGNANDTSTLSNPTFTYPDTGTYVVTLVVNKGELCTDSTTAIAKVYPGFSPKFGVYGNCINEAYQFVDSTTTQYGIVNSWDWNFDTVHLVSDFDVFTQDPAYNYPDTGTKVVRLIVGNSKGCLDTLSKVIDVSSSPTVQLPFNDTTICIIDSVQLRAGSGNSIGSYSWRWSPDYNILDTASQNTIVFPKQTTTYYVSLNDHKGCEGTDSILVNVIPKVLVSIQPDTTICKSDSFTINPSTNALKFVWSPGASLNDSTAENPIAAPSSNITYTVTARVGSCVAFASKIIKVVPYPQVQTFSDTSICYGDKVLIHGVIKGAYYQWSPTNSLLNANTLSPTAGPQATTSYVLSVTDTIGCPKPSTDTVTVIVIPKVVAFAGNDTAVTVNQPLQLKATGGSEYLWSPTTGMNDPTVFNPIVTLKKSPDSITYIVKVTVPQGCFNYDSVTVVVFKTGPKIFVPSAFTPNGDGENDIFKPIVVGVQNLVFFNVYNRWGNLLFSTSRIGIGWDGTVHGIKQASGTYVYSAEAVDYSGKTIVAKGTVVLIR